MMRGLVKWQGGAIVDAKMGLVREGFMMPHRYSLGDLDEDQWEKGPDGEVRDPWTQSYLVQLIELSPPHGTLTFSGGSYGAKLACQDICKVYSEQGPAQPDIYPVVELGTKSRASKSYGKIVGPWFDVVGWATADDVKAGRKAGGGKAKPKAIAPLDKSALKPTPLEEAIAAKVEEGDALDDIWTP